MFALALIPLSLILIKAKAACEFSESKQRINHLLFMDDLKMYSQSEEGLDSLVQTARVISEDIGMEFGITKCANGDGQRKDCEVSWCRVTRW